MNADPAAEDAAVLRRSTEHEVVAKLFVDGESGAVPIVRSHPFVA